MNCNPHGAEAQKEMIEQLRNKGHAL